MPPGWARGRSGARCIGSRCTSGAQAYRVEVADALYERGLSLPCSVGITADERQAVAAALVAALGTGGSE